MDKLLGGEIFKFFQSLQLQKDFKQCYFKLNKPIKLDITYFVNGEKFNLKVTNEIKLKFSGNNAPQNFAKFLFASLLLMTKENKVIDVTSLLDSKDYFTMKENSILSESNKAKIHKLCDSDISELTELLKLN